MFRALVRFVLVLVVLVAVAAFFFGYRWGGARIGSSAQQPAVRTERPVGTTGTKADERREKARAAGAAIGDTVAVGAEKASENLEEAALTTKVKSKMTLDDTLNGSRIHVTTDDNVVTLTGTVIDERQHARALQLARETIGVAMVVDHLSIGTR